MRPPFGPQEMDSVGEILIARMECGAPLGLVRAHAAWFTDRGQVLCSCGGYACSHARKMQRA